MLQVMQPKRLFSNILRTRSIIMLECRNSSRMDGGARENFAIFCQKLFLYFGNFAHFLTDWQGSLLCRICKKFGGNHVILGFLQFLWIWTNIWFAVRIQRNDILNYFQWWRGEGTCSNSGWRREMKIEEKQEKRDLDQKEEQDPKKNEE